MLLAGGWEGKESVYVCVCVGGGGGGVGGAYISTQGKM